MKVVCFGQQNWAYCWTSKQQLLTRLARRGHRVLYVDPDSIETTSSWRESVAAVFPWWSAGSVREEHPDVLVYTHRHAPILGWRLNQWRKPRLLRRVLARHGFDGAAAIVLHPSAEPFLDAAEPQGLIYFAVDEATAFPNMPPERQRALRAAEDRLLVRADAAVGVSPRLAERFRTIQPETDLLENAADLEHFSPARLQSIAGHPRLATLPRPRIGFVGQVDERLDQDLLLFLARARPGWQIVLAGRCKPGVDVSALEAQPNIHLLGYQPYAELPGVLREIDVCLIPYRLNPLTHACNPLKAYEYLATGRPVVATPLEGLGGARGVMRVASTPQAFLDAVSEAVADPGAGRAERLAFARENGWDARVDVLERRLEAIRASRRPRISRADVPLSPLFADDRLSPAAALAIRTLSLLGRVYHAGRVVVRRVTGRRPVAIRRILVARRCRLGDLVVFLPTLHALRRRFPHARIVLGVQHGAATGSFHTQLPVDEIRPLDFLDSEGRGRRLWRVLRLFAEGFDLMIAGGGFFLLREAYFAGAPYRLGLRNGHRLQRLSNRPLELDTSLHEADNNLALVEAFTGQIVPPATRVPRLAPAPPEAHAAASALLESHGVPADAPLLTVHAGAQKPSRRWPADRYAALLAGVLAEQRDAHVLLTGVRDEQAVADEVRAALPPGLRRRAHNVAGRTSLAAMVALMERSRVVICNDTGTMHVARARGAPLVALLGPENHRRWGPHPEGPGPAIALRHEVPCAPCTRWDCEPLYCMRSLEVDEAARAVRTMWQAPQTDGGTAGGRTPLDLTLVRHDWASLHDAGFALPLVTVVLLARRHARRDASPPDDAQTIRQMLATVDAQRYPCIEVVTLDAVAAPDAPFGRLPVGAATTSTSHDDEQWRAVLSAAAGEFLVPMAPGAAWPPDKLSEEVAMLIRHPDAATAAPPAHAGSPLLMADLAMVRRAALEQALNIPTRGQHILDERRFRTAAPLGDGEATSLRGPEAA